MFLRRGRFQPHDERLELFADYFQVHVSDDAAKGDLSEAWDDDALARGLAVADGIVGVTTARNVAVPVHVTVSRQGPQVDPDAWDTVVEADLRIRSGHVVVMGCTDDYDAARRLPVGTGWYRLRASTRGLDTVVRQWEDASDEYRIQLWRSEPQGVHVIKRRPVV